LARKILAGEIPEGSTVQVNVVEGELAIEAQRQESPAGERMKEEV
jgi:hypothetical protein